VCTGFKHVAVILHLKGTQKQIHLRKMRLMWTPPALWNRPADEFELEQVRSCKSRLKNLKSLKSELRKMLIWALRSSKILCFPIWCYKAELFHCSFNVVSMEDITSKFYVGHMSMKSSSMPNIHYVISLKWSWVR
jgi:hypothetical protein